MPETEVDRRGYRLLLVSHSVLATPPGHRSVAGVADAVVAWADSVDAGLYQLPVPAHALRPRTASGRFTRPTRSEISDEREDLRFVFGQLAVYTAAGYRLLGLVLRAEDEATQAGRAWLGQVTAVAAEQGVEVPRVWRIASGATTFAPLEPSPVDREPTGRGAA